MSSKRRSYESGHKRKYLVVIDDTDKYAARIKKIARIEPERAIREGDTAEEIVKAIDEDADIGILVLAAGTAKEGPGPLVSNLSKTAGTFPIPVALVPGHLSDEDLEAMS